MSHLDLKPIISINSFIYDCTHEDRLVLVNDTLLLLSSCLISILFIAIRMCVNARSFLRPSIMSASVKTVLISYSVSKTLTKLLKVSFAIWQCSNTFSKLSMSPQELHRSVFLIPHLCNNLFLG